MDDIALVKLGDGKTIRESDIDKFFAEHPRLTNFMLAFTRFLRYLGC